jgi:hypothetical protein
MTIVPPLCPICNVPECGCDAEIFDFQSSCQARAAHKVATQYGLEMAHACLIVELAGIATGGRHA